MVVTDELRLKRKRVLALMQEQQQADANFASHFSDMVTASHRKILKILVRFLDRLQTGKPDFQNSSEIAKRINSAFNPQSWVTQIAERQTCVQNLELAKNKAATASERYSKHSPFGFLDRILHDDATKAESLRLKRASDAATQEVLSMESMLSVKDDKIRQTAEIFLRAAVMNEGLFILCATKSSIQEEIKAELSSLEKKLHEHWTTHCESQAASLEEASVLIASLTTAYSENKASTDHDTRLARPVKPKPNRSSIVSSWSRS